MAEPMTEDKLLQQFEGAEASIRDIVGAMHEAAHVIVIRDLGHLDTQVGQEMHENGLREHWTKVPTSAPAQVVACSITAALIITEAVENVAPGILHAPTDWERLCAMTRLTPDEIRASDQWRAMLDWIMPRREEIGKIATEILKGQEIFRWEGDQKMIKVTEYQHSAECQARHERWKEEMAKFEAAYPNYCRNCGGYGAIGYDFDPSPPGVSLSPGRMYGEDPCPDCEEQGKCGLCGAELGPDEDECERVCGCSHDVFAPAEPECFCWEKQLEEAEARLDLLKSQTDGD